VRLSIFFYCIKDHAFIILKNKPLPGQLLDTFNHV